MKFVLVMIVASIGNDGGSIEQLTLYELDNLTQARCEELAGVNNRLSEGKIKEQSWSVCRPAYMGGA